MARTPTKRKLKKESVSSSRPFRATERSRKKITAPAPVLLTKPRCSAQLELRVPLSETNGEAAAWRWRAEQLEARVRWLEQERHVYSRLFDAVPVGYVLLDGAGHITEANHQAAALLGVPSGTALEGVFSQFVAKGSLAQFLSHLRQCRFSRKPVNTELSLRNFLGQLVPVMLTSMPAVSASGHLRFRTAFIDMSARRSAERKLMQTERDYQTVLSAIEGVVWEARGATMEITFVNDFAERMLGYPLQRWTEPGFWENHIHVDDRERVMSLVARALTRKEDFTVDYRVLRADRRVLWIHDSIAVQTHQGTTRFFGIAVDITNRKNTEQHLQHAQATLERRVAERTAELQETISELEAFSYSLSHDMRAPLRAIQGYSQLILNRFARELGPTGQDYLRRMMGSSERLDQLITDVLQYSRVSRTAVRLSPVNLEQMVNDIIHDYPALQPPNAEIEIKKPLLPVLGHEAFLNQCISNLLSNAVKFFRPGLKPTVRVWTEPGITSVKLFVEDNGIGIPLEDQRRIFGIFERVNPPDKYEGTGIGLAIVQKAAERMGGTVGVESVYGSGSKFWLQLQRGVE